MALDEKTLKIIVDFLIHKISDVELLIIFGSGNNQHFNPEKSDIDIAFLCAKKLMNVKRWDIQEKLASLLNINVDLVDLRQDNDVLKFEILHKGKIIYQNKSLEQEIFLDNIYVNYIQLNEDRAEILEHYS